MSMFSKEEARKLLEQAGVFFYTRDEEEDWEECPQTLNMNDVWAWACSDGERIEDEQLPEVAELFFLYGWCGILYWVSKQNNNLRSEFLDNNRFIDFVEQEEKLRKEVPNSSDRAYKKITYTLGE